MIIFIRHNSLVAPFENYDTLTYQDLIGLSNQKISPDISHNIKENSILQKLNGSEVNKIYTSSLERTQQTSILLGYEMFEIVQELDEIYFDIEKLLSEDEYKMYGLSIVRERLWEFIFHGKDGVENIDSLSGRVQKICNILGDAKGQDLLFISHGFFLTMLLVQLKHHKNLSTLTLEEFLGLNISPINYLDGFVLS